MAELFDRSGALERVDNDIELLIELVQICKEEYQSRFPELIAAAGAGNTKVAGDMAHSMKSAFGNVGAMIVHGSALALEKAGRAGKAEEMSPLVSKLESDIKAFFEHFDSIVSTLTPG